MPLGKNMSQGDKVIAQILQGSPIPTFVIDDNYLITHWNNACERLTGVTASKMIGTKRQWFAFYSEEKPVMADLIVDRAPEEELVKHFGNGLQKSTYIDGAYEAEGFFPGVGERGRWLFCTAAPLKDDQGKILGAVTTLQDITARKQTEEALLYEQQELERRVEKSNSELTSINIELKKEIVWRKRIEGELKQSENIFRTVADFTYDWEYWIDPQGTLVYQSPSCERITGYGAKEFMEKSDLLVSIVYPDDQVEFRQHLKEEMMAERASHVDFRIITKEGEERWISHFCQPVFDAYGTHLGRRASNRDVTKRKQLEATLKKEREKLEIQVEKRTEQLSSAYDSLQDEVKSRRKTYEVLKESEEELRKRNQFIETVLDNLPLGLAVRTIADDVVHYMNAYFTEIYGWPKDALGSFAAFLEHVYPDPVYRKMIKKKITKGISTRDPLKMIWENVLPTTQSGEQRVVNARSIPLFEQDLIISVAQDITEKHKADEALQFTRFSIDNANDMIYWVDSEGKIVDVNETTCIKLGCTKDELLSMTVMDINPSLTIDKFYDDWENIKNHDAWRVETSHYCISGEAIPVEIHINHIEFSGKEHICVFARDITERKELERLVTIQDKMGSLGRVAAGIAHEIRNPLSTINVYLSALKRLLESEDFDATNLANIKDAIDEMDSASHKIEIVVKRVMDFSKPSQRKMQLMNVNQCVRDAVDLSVVTLRKSEIALGLQLDGNLPECYLDSQLIEQVMLNLITNAIEELLESQDKRQLEVTTAETRPSDGERFIVITVADSGSGVASELRDKIFDPFFTTKNYGSGIGLSICHRIISDHNGSLRVSTSKWGGAQFSIEFPVTNEVAG